MLRRSATILTLALALLLAGAGRAGEPAQREPASGEASSSDPASDGPTSGLVSPADLAATITRDDGRAPQVLDVRTSGEFAEGHVPGAILIPHDTLAQRLGELDRSRPVVVYCRSGRRSTLAEGVLREAGFEVSQLQGSWQAWQADGLPVQTGVPGEPNP